MYKRGIKDGPLPLFTTQPTTHYYEYIIPNHNHASRTAGTTFLIFVSVIKPKQR